MADFRAGALAALVSAVAMSGCGDAPPVAVDHTISRAELAALPVDTVAAGDRLCLATGYDACPLRQAVANRLDDRRIALWQPGHTIGIWQPGDTTLTPLGAFGPDSTTQYLYVVALRSDGRGYQMIEARNPAFTLTALDAEGRVIDRTPLPAAGPLAVVGFTRGAIVRQAFADWTTPARGEMRITRLARVGDSTGTDLLITDVRWMHDGDRTQAPIPALVSANPVWALTPDQGIVWSPGSPFVIEARDRNGAVRWRLTGPAGPAVTDSALALREAAVRTAAELLPFDSLDFAAMRVRSDSVFPAINGLATTPSGGILVAGATIPGRDSVEYYRFEADGTARSRFSLPAAVRILLAEGDSLLVHQPTEADPQEIRWLRLVGP